MSSFQKLLELDYEISREIASWLQYDGVLRKFLHVITLTGTAFAWLVALPFAYYFFTNFQSEAFSMFIITGLMTLLVYLIKLIVRRPRPEFKDDRYLSVSFDKFSFPSGHATRAAYVAILMPMYTPNLAIFWYIWAAFMIISRLALGVHYISDIIIGIVLGSLVIIIFLLIGWLPFIPLPEYLIY